MDDIFHQAMKEWYWFAIVGALVSIAFAPSFLKGKCPKCSKRKLVTVPLDDATTRALAAEGNERQFLSFYTCGGCDAQLLRERTGPFEDATAKSWQQVFNNADDSAALVR